jgi:hypothetical protein
MKYFSSTILILVFSIFTVSVQAQAWTKDKGHGFFKLDYSLLSGNKLFDDDAKIIDYRDYQFSTVSFYGEYGLSRRLSLVGYVPLIQNNKVKASGNMPKASNTAFGDIDVALRYALFKDKFPLTVTLQLGLPTGDHDDVNELFTGDGEFNQMVKVSSGGGTEKWWIQGGLGYNNRSENFSDEIRFDAEFGIKLFNKKLLPILKFGAVSPLDNGSAPVTRTGLYSNNVSYFSPAIEILYFINSKFGIALRGAGASPTSRNVQATPSLSFAVFGDF